MVLILWRTFLHMAANALVCDRQTMGRGLKLRRAGRQLADISQKDIILRRVVRGPAGARQRCAPMIVALGAQVDVGIILAGKGGRSSNEIIVGRERRIE